MSYISEIFKTTLIQNFHVYMFINYCRIFIFFSPTQQELNKSTIEKQ